MRGGCRRSLALSLLQPVLRSATIVLTRLRGATPVAESYLDLDERGKLDRDRYLRKVRDLLREHAADVFTSDEVITAPDGSTVHIRIPDIHEPRFRYAEDEPETGVGSGSGDPGDVLGQRPLRGGEQGGAGQGHEAPSWIEVEVPLEEVAEWVFERLGLPPVESRKTGEPEREDSLTSRGRRGAILDKKRTLLEHRKREMSIGQKAAWRSEDLVYRRWRESERPSVQAVLVLVRDASGSVTEEQSLMIRTAAFWAVTWLRRNYPKVRVRFIVHDTQAQEVEEKDFFRPLVMGGTMISSGLGLAEEILEHDHPAESWNRYVLFFSDGEDWPDDFPEAVRRAKGLADSCELVGYGETVSKSPWSRRLSEELKAILPHPSFRQGPLRSPRDVAGWLKTVFGEAGAA